MKSILDIYQHYQIMPQLAEHQLRVAAVGELLGEHMDVAVDTHNVTAALLLHDMGNITKFDFGEENLQRMPGLVDPAQVPYWEGVKQEFIARYGSTDSHVVTIKIVRELGVTPRILKLVDSVGFEEGIASAEAVELEPQICSYADERVAPRGVVSLEERLADLRIRYHNHPEGKYNREQFEEAMRQTERRIFQHCNIRPEEITEQAIAERKEKLKNFLV